MDTNSQNFSMEDALRLARSPAAQQLIAAIKAKNPDALDRAATQAAAGNLEQAQKDLRSLLSDPTIQALLRQLGG